MQVKVLCVGITPEIWGKDKAAHEQRHVNRLNLIDTDDFCQVKDTFDYVLSKEEEERIDVEKLKMAVFTVGVSEWDKEHGRLKARRGKIDLGTVPPTAFKRPGSVDSAPLPTRDNGKTVLNGTSAEGAKRATVAA